MYAIVNMEGRVTSEPAFRKGKGDREFCTFGFVVNEQYGGQEISSFYNCTGNEVIAARVRKASLTKGRLIHIVGKISLREYQTSDKQTKISADVGILDWSYAGSKPKSDDAQKGSAAPAANSGSGTVNQEQYIGDDDELPI